MSLNHQANIQEELQPTREGSLRVSQNRAFLTYTYYRICNHYLVHVVLAYSQLTLEVMVNLGILRARWQCSGTTARWFRSTSGFRHRFVKPEEQLNYAQPRR
ncbi:hypothetical protein M404DRAFT_762719 [Pisolithus tinctorius Marx 270]|uniref:Uncharacterized protein n=1 Tax=Pisolithus tinctorius Marx 270 TaxID=870435 RepID=A0A0C3NYN4_PISTI|nr:hypothetical protein M404DRAFT_762719 [Pisolithus tinctorius Marx 270]